MINDIELGMKEAVMQVSVLSTSIINRAWLMTMASTKLKLVPLRREIYL